MDSVHAARLDQPPARVALERRLIQVGLAADDPFRTRYDQDALIFPRTQPDTMPTPGMLTYRNEVTAWWDGSQIYGSDQVTQDEVRAGADGRSGRWEVASRRRLPPRG